MGVFHGCSFRFSRKESQVLAVLTFKGTFVVERRCRCSCCLLEGLVHLYWISSLGRDQLILKNIAQPNTNNLRLRYLKLIRYACVCTYVQIRAHGQAHTFSFLSLSRAFYDFSIIVVNFKHLAGRFTWIWPGTELVCLVAACWLPSEVHWSRVW